MKEESFCTSCNIEENYDIKTANKDETKDNLKNFWSSTKGKITMSLLVLLILIIIIFIFCYFFKK